ncbi:putative Polycomb group protein ASXL3 isoform X2 [Stegodyphus dumicola]|uniref:putative Polycomb group protein ASXL3 isoform X2 n=1 Tax=Stegodyphus dumicola TaxID=202533 RepID=UPI0015B22D96|nr:putative Polycomb group protein ASXL3 isoform X2 [Stegodyphus dumicola]
MVICVSGKMQIELSKERQVRKKKARTWTEAAKLALELYPKTPLGHKDIFNVIRVKGLKDVSGPASLACLNAMLHVHSRGPEAMFYRVDGCTSVFGLASNIPEGGVKMEVDEDDSGQEFDPVDSDQDSGASISSPCGRKKDRVLYVRLPPGFKNFSLSLNNNSHMNHQEEAVLHKADQLTVKPLTYKNEYYTRVRRINGENVTEDAKKEKCNQASAANLPVSSPAKVSQSHSQRAIKHALRQQQKRRRRNTAIAASGSAPPPIPRIIMKSLPPAPAGAGCVPEERWRCSLEKTSLRESTRHKPQTMRELLASIPGLSFKPRKRSSRKLSTAAQIAQTKKGCINIETPDSILVNTNLRALLNKHTFASLPAVYQYRLVQLLPQADRMIGPDYSVRLTATALSNEFFARACQEWKRRLQEGEFTPENQMKLKGEAERDHSKLDPWKIHNFEPVWGHNSVADISDQGKSSSFLINSQLKPLNNQNKHVPTIKIKPVVRKSRLNSSISKHRNLHEQDSPSHSDENHPSESPLYNETSDMDVTAVQDTSDNLFGPPPKKIKVSEQISSNSSESQESSEESIHTVTHHSPCPSRSPSPASTPSPSNSADELDLAKDTDTMVSSVIPISLSITVVQTTAPSQSLVPPITIRSVPIIRSNGGKKNSNRNDGGINLERSYQICKAALESTCKKDPIPSGERTQIQPRTSDVVCMVTSYVASPENCVLNDKLEDTSSVNQSQKLDDSKIEAVVTMQDVQSSSKELLLTTCPPSAIPTPELNSISSNLNLLETSNICTNADNICTNAEVSSAEVDSVDSSSENSLSLAKAESDSSEAACPVVESTLTEESEMIPGSSVPNKSADLLESLAASPEPLSVGPEDHVVSLADNLTVDQELKSSTNICSTDRSPTSKCDSVEEDSVENTLPTIEEAVVPPSDIINNNEKPETNVSSTLLLENDLNSLPSECLDSDSSSMQQPYNNSQVVDEDSTIILSLPSSEEENVTSDAPNITVESMPEKELPTDDADSKLSVEDSNNSCSNSQISAIEEKQDNFETESTDGKLGSDELSCEKSQSPCPSEKATCPESPAYGGENCVKECVAKVQFDPPSRPLSAPSNFPPMHVNSVIEVSSLKRPASCQSYYRSAKVSPIVYFDSPESDDAKSDSDKGDKVPTSSPQSSDVGLIPYSSSASAAVNISSSIKKEHPVSVSKSLNCAGQMPVEFNDKNSSCNKQVSQAQDYTAPPGRSLSLSRSASTPSNTSSMQCLSPVVHRPLSNPSVDTSVMHQISKMSSSEYQTCVPVTNPLSLPEGCTGGTGGSLPSQAVSVVPATTQLPIASGGIMFPSANGLTNVVGTPAGDTPPRSLLLSSPVINGASSGIEGAVTSAGGDSGGDGNGTSGFTVSIKVPRKKYFLRKRNRKLKNVKF